MSCRNWVSRTSSSQDVADRINLPSCSRGHISSPGASLHCSLGSRPAAVSTALCKASEMEMKMRTIVGALAVAALMAGAPAPASAEMRPRRHCRAGCEGGATGCRENSQGPSRPAADPRDRQRQARLRQPGMVARGGAKPGPSALSTRQRQPSAGGRGGFSVSPFLSWPSNPAWQWGPTSSPIEHIPTRAANVDRGWMPATDVGMTEVAAEARDKSIAAGPVPPLSGYG